MQLLLTRSWIMLGMVMLAGSVHLQAATVLIDFGGGGNATTVAGTTWNNVTGHRVGSAGSSIFNLLNTTGTESNFGIAVTGDFNGVNSNGVTTGAPAYPANAQMDSFFGNTQTSTSWPTIYANAQLTLSNLDPLALYTFTFFASRSGATPSRSTVYTVQGTGAAKSDTLEVANNVSDVAIVSSVQADANGQIVINLAPGASNGTTEKFYYIGVLQIDSVAVPEPGKAVLLLMALAGAVFIRRR